MQARCFILLAMLAMAEPNWQAAIVSAARDAKVSCDSIEIVADSAHARVLTALLRAFGRQSGYLYAEPRTPERRADENARPTDCLLLTNALGALLVEVKGWTIDQIDSIDGGTVLRQTGGFHTPHNPWKQAQEASGQIQRAVRKLLSRMQTSAAEIPYFDWIVAFPHISTHAWIAKGFSDCLQRNELLFAEDLADPAALCRRLESQIKSRARHRVPCSAEQLDLVRRALGSSSIPSHRNHRISVQPIQTLGQAIDLAESRSKRLFPEQNKLAEAEFDGRPQLIRGVAGSGKTTVLVKNLANMVDRHLHFQGSLLAKERPKRYAMVCYNHSLVPMLRRSFDDAYFQLTGSISPDSLHITYFNGLFWELSKRGAILYQRYGDYADLPDYPKDRQIAQNYCSQLEHLEHTDATALTALQLDAIYVDEGQDLFEEQYRALMYLLKPDAATGQKNLVVGYDDAQNLYGRPRPTWKNLGIEVAGRSAVMKTCYRNTRQIVEFAFNLLLGAAAETRAMTREFADSNELKKLQLVEELPDRWLVHFAARKDGKHPEVALFLDREAEKQWVADKVRLLIDQQGVRPSDILILFENGSKHHYFDFGTRIQRQCSTVKAIRQPHGKADNKQKDEYIFEDGALTVTTVGAAKGYDCPIVFVLGTDCFPLLTEGRAAFYVAATRAKMELFVTGLRGRDSLAEEAEAVSVQLAQPLTAEIKVVAAPAPVVEAQTFKRGALVRHPHYGFGRVLEDPKPTFLHSLGVADLQVTIRFQDKIKSIVAGLANLQAVAVPDQVSGQAPEQAADAHNRG